MRLSVERSDAVAEIDLGEQGRIWPSDDALARWKTVAFEGKAKIVYGGG